MNMTDDNRLRLREGLDWLIKVQEAQIERIQTKTEKDYPAAKALESFMKEPFSLEREKMEETMKAKAEIKRLHELSNLLNSTRNQILVVPDTIRLHLTAEPK